MVQYYDDFKISQYEEYNKNRFLMGEHVNARYVLQDQPEHQNNPLIEALPPPMEFGDVVQLIEKVPLYSEIEREKSRVYRIHAVSRLSDYLLPTIKYENIEKSLSLSIRNGYISRSIMTPDSIKKLNQTSGLLSNTWVENLSNSNKSIIKNNKTDIYGFSIIGMSGMGKSTAVNNLLSLYPQCIIHTEYSGRKFLYKQLVWLKIDCTHNGTVKGICQNFFKKVDEILGTNTFEKYGKDTLGISAMKVAMAHIVQRHALGALIIDEIQHLANAGSKSGKVLDFFVTLSNEIKVPIIFIGTFKTYKSVLGNDYRQSSRSEGIGVVNWNMMDNHEWDYFIEDLWQYQWTKEKVELSDELKQIMFEKAIGITRRLVRIFQASQIKAIMSGEEKITIDIIKEVADEHFSLSKDMIKALREGNERELVNYDDIPSPDLSNLTDNAIDSIKVQEEINKIRESNKTQEKKRKRDIVNELVIYVSQIGIDTDELIDICSSEVDTYGTKKDIEFLKRRVIEKVLGFEANKEASSSKSKKSKKKTKSKNNAKVEIDTEKFKEENVKGII